MKYILINLPPLVLEASHLKLMSLPCAWGLGLSEQAGNGMAAP